MAEEYCACGRDGGRENESKCEHELDQSKMSFAIQLHRNRAMGYYTACTIDLR